MLVIPGNPGVAGYYIPFLRYLKRSLLPQRADVFACSYFGHTRQITPRGASKVMLVTITRANVLQRTAQDCGRYDLLYRQEHRRSSNVIHFSNR